MWEDNRAGSEAGMQARLVTEALRGGVEDEGWWRAWGGGGVVLRVQGSAKARLVTEVLAARRAEGEAERAASGLLDMPAHTAQCHGWGLGASLGPRRG